MSAFALQARNVTKNFGDFKALNGVSFDVQPGEFFGLLGPNGAGKSTLLKMSYGQIIPTSGDFFALGMNVRTSGREIRARVGVVPQDDGLDVELTVKENLTVFARFFGIPAKVAEARALDLLRMMRLDDLIDERVEKLSSGYRRRLIIARSLVNHPEILILDEPTIGLDPQIRSWIWDFLRKIKEHKRTILLTTHYMEEAESLCDRLAIVDKGQILAVGSRNELVRSQLAPFIVEFHTAEKDLSYYLNRIREKNLNFFVVGNQVFVPQQGEGSAREFMAQISSREISFRETTLNDVFLSLSGRELRGEPK